MYFLLAPGGSQIDEGTVTVHRTKHFRDFVNHRNIHYCVTLIWRYFPAILYLILCLMNTFSLEKDLNSSPTLLFDMFDVNLIDTNQ